MATPTAPAWREVLRGPRGRLVIGLLGLETVAAVEALVATTAMPAAVRQLGHLGLYGWVFSVPSLATVAAIPIAVRELDRVGPRRPLLLVIALLGGGTVLAGAAPDIWTLILARLLQGFGAGAGYGISVGTVARDLPAAHRARVLALLAGAWVVPGMVAPALGAILAQTAGWRWAFWAFLPLMALSTALVWPALGRAGGRTTGEGAAPLRWSLQVLAGGVACLGGLTSLTPATLPLLALGLALGWPAVRHLSAAGHSVAPAALRAALGMVTCLTLGFFAINNFLPLLLTRLRGESLILAGLVITTSTVGWSAGSWWQSRVVIRTSRRGLIAGGGGALAVGTALTATTLLGAPVVVADLAWALAGFGIGAAYPTVYLVAMEAARASSAAATTGLVLVMDTIGAAAGAGLGGSAIAVARQTGHGLRAGLLGAFGVGLVAALAVVGIALAPRLRAHLVPLAERARPEPR